MKRNGRWLVVLTVVGMVFMIGSVYDAFGFTINGSVEQKTLVTGATISTKAKTILKIKFVNKTSGTSLELCAGDVDDFTAGICPTVLSVSGGIEALTILDASQLFGKHIYVIKSGGTASANFEITIE